MFEVFATCTSATPRKFSEYHEIQKQGVRDTVRNSLSRAHSRPYPPISAFSSGYDTTACAVLAKEAGCTEAATLPKAEITWGEDFNDSGTPGTEALGLSVTECESGEASRAGGSGKFSERPFLREASQRSPMQTRASFPGPEK